MTKFSSYDAGTPCWIDLNSPDVDASIEFYEAVFDWTHEDSDDGEGTRIYTNFHKDGDLVCGLGGQQPGMEGMPAMWTTYIAVEDAEATLKKGEEAGGQVVAPAMQVMEQGKMGIMTDPAGGAIAVWQAGEHHGAQLCNEPDTWSWNELLSRDLGAAKQFYTDVFGWSYQTMDMDGLSYHVIEGGEEGGLGGLMDMPDNLPDEVPSNWGVYFWVADAQATMDKAVEAGGQAMFGPDPTPIGLIAGLVDPHGGTFSLLQPTPDDGEDHGAGQTDADDDK